MLGGNGKGRFCTVSEASATLTQLGGIYDSPRHIDRQDRVRLLGSGLAKH